MAPFPEDEVITIKRLEYALKHSDYRLLRDGAYKLHEKYHSHHHFVYTDLLKIILEEVEENQAIPPEVKDILVSTIQDILKEDDSEDTQEIESRVSGLTSLSYGVNSGHKESVQNEQPEDEQQPEETKEESYIKPFQEFTPIQPIEMVQNYKKDEEIVENYKEAPTEDFITETPIVQQQNIFEHDDKEEEIPQYLTSEQDEKEDIQENAKQEEDYSSEVQNEAEEVSENNFIKIEEEDNSETYQEEEEYQDEIKIREDEEEIQEEENIPEEIQEENTTNYSEFSEEESEDEEEIQEENTTNYSESPDVEEEVISEETGEENMQNEDNSKTVAIFYSQNSSNEKISNILKYRELLYNKKDFSLSEITSLINEIKTQTDNSVSELQIFLERLQPTGHSVNLITNSQSANLVNLLSKCDITYSIFDSDSEKRVNILSFMGLSNLYKCIECDEEYLDTNDKINSFILQCPKCKKAMLPELYATKGEINMEYYNSSLTTLANSQVWLLMRPSLNDKLAFDMIKSAIKVSKKVREVYILDKDINIKESYKRIFEEFCPDVEVYSNINAMEEFLSRISK